MNHNTTKQIFSTKILAEVIILVAAAGALSLLSNSFFHLPQGGSINIGMIPILWLALRRGPAIGIFAGAVFGMVDLAIEPFIVHPIQLILDYPLAFAALGLAGFFRTHPVTGTVISVTARFICHFASGIIYFAPASGENPAVYSAIYNGSYMLPSLIICAMAVFTLQKSNTIDIYMQGIAKNGKIS